MEDHLYRTEKYAVWKCEALDQSSESGESEADFRIRMTQKARERRDAKKEAVRTKFEKKIDNAKAALRKAAAHVSEQKSQFWMKIFVILGNLVAMFAGGKGRRSRGVSLSSASQAMRERGEQSRAEQRLEDKQIELEELEDELQKHMTEIEINFEPSNLRLEKREVPLRKSDTTVDPISLVWLPWQIDADGATHPAY